MKQQQAKPTDPRKENGVSRGRLALCFVGAVVIGAVVFAPVYIKHSKSALDTKTPAVETIQGNTDAKTKAALFMIQNSVFRPFAESLGKLKKTAPDKPQAKQTPVIPAFRVCQSGECFDDKAEARAHGIFIDGVRTGPAMAYEPKKERPKQTAPETPKKEPTTKKFNTGAALIESYNGGEFGSWKDIQ